MNAKEHIWNGLRWALLVLAYGYLAYRLYTYDDYALFLRQLSTASLVEYLCLAGCVLLLPLNILLESLKWRTLLSSIYPMSVHEAQRQVYYGAVGAFVTPYRAGDIPSRVLLMKDYSCWKQAIGMGLYGGVMLSVVIVLVGWIPALLFFGKDVMQHMQVYLLIAGVLFAGICFLPFLKRWLPQLSTVLSGKTLVVFVQCFARYIVFSIQLYLMLRFVGVVISPLDVCIAIPTYYLLVTLTPNMPAADAGIRGSWAILVFSKYSDAVPQIAMAAVGLWIINTILPFIIGSCLSHPSNPSLFGQHCADANGQDDISRINQSMGKDYHGGNPQ